MESPQILFIAPTRIGDAVLASSVLRHIAATQPTARVTIATSELAAPLHESYPLLNRIIPMRKKPYSGHWIELLKQTWGTRWQAVWDMRNSATGYLLRARERHRFPGNDDPIPKVEQYARTLKTGDLPYPVLWTHEAHRAQAKAMLPDGANYLLLAPCANFAGKEWPMEHYIALGRRLLAEDGPCSDWRPVVICAAHERERGLQLVEALSVFRPVDLTRGALPLLSVFACMQRAQGFIGNDSGLMHMAAAAGIPTLGLFGLTPPEIYGPYGLRTSYLRGRGNEIKNLSVDEVAGGFTALLHT